MKWVLPTSDATNTCVGPTVGGMATEPCVGKDQSGLPVLPSMAKTFGPLDCVLVR